MTTDELIAKLNDLIVQNNVVADPRDTPYTQGVLDGRIEVCEYILELLGTRETVEA